MSTSPLPSPTAQTSAALVDCSSQPQPSVESSRTQADFSVPSGLFSSPLTEYPDGLLVSASGGVGDKLSLAFAMDRHDTVGIDCVAMCVNELLCSGARPLYFLPRLCMGKASSDLTDSILSGLEKGCRLAGCALLGSQTTEASCLYPEGKYDLAGFSVGVTAPNQMPDGSSMQAGDILLGLGSSGLHTGGYALACQLLDLSKESLDTAVPELGCTLGEALLRPSRIYSGAVQCLLHHGVHVRAIRHISGGLLEHLPDMMPQGLTARIESGSFPVPPILELIAQESRLTFPDLCSAFNMGVGLVLTVPRQEVGHAKNILCRAGERAYIIGSVVSGETGAELA